MPKILDHQEASLRRIIRDALAIDPLLTVTGVCRVVEAKIKRQVDPRYIKRLIKKVTGEMAVVADREKVEDRISHLRERNRIICDELFRMAFPGPNAIQPDIMDRRKALEAIARIEANQAKLEMDFGLFTRHLGELNVDHRMKPLDDQTLGAISAAWKMWGPTPQMRKLESTQPVLKVEAKVIKDEPASNTTTKRNDTVIPAVTRAGLVATE